MRFKSAQEVDVYVKHILSLNTAKSATKMASSSPEVSAALEPSSSSPLASTTGGEREYWPLIARLYLSVQAHEKALKYAQEYLSLHPNNFEVNLLQAMQGSCLAEKESIYRVLGYLERAACLHPDPKGVDKRIAKYCLDCVRDGGRLVAEASVGVELLSKGMYWLKKELPFTGGRYTHESLLLLCELLEALIKIPFSQWKDDGKSVLDGFLVELVDGHAEILTLPLLHLHILKVFMMGSKLQLAWNAILEACMVINSSSTSSINGDHDSLAWFEYVCEQSPLFERKLQKVVDAEDVFFFHDSLCRLSVMQLSNTDDETLIQSRLNDFEKVLELRTRSPSSSLSVADWNSVRMEYLARFHYYMSVWLLKKLKLPLQADSVAKQQISQIVSNLHLALSHPVQSVLDNGDSFMRVALSRNAMLSVLACYNIDWIQNKDVNPMRSGYLTADDDVKSLKFSMHTMDKLVVPSDFISKEILELELADRIVMVDPWNLSQFLWLQMFQISNGGMRVLLRKLFPKIPEYPPYSQLNSASEFALTCGDIETFLIELSLAKHANIISKYRATSNGQVLLLSHPAIWQPTELQKSFWTSCLALYGSPSLPQHSRFVDSVLPKQQLIQYLSEIRGTPLNPTCRMRDFYFMMAYVFYDLTSRHQIDRSVECAQFIRAYKKLEFITSDLMSDESHLFCQIDKSEDNLMDRLFIEIDQEFVGGMDIDALEGRLHQLKSTRYQQYLGNPDISSISIKSPEKAVNNENKIHNENTVANEDSIEQDEPSTIKFEDISMIEERPRFRKDRSSRQFQKLKALKEESIILEKQSPAKSQPQSILKAEAKPHAVKTPFSLDEDDLFNPATADSSSFQHSLMKSDRDSSTTKKQAQKQGDFFSVYEKLKQVSLEETPFGDSTHSSRHGSTTGRSRLSQSGLSPRYFSSTPFDGHQVTGSDEDITPTANPGTGKKRLDRQFELLAKLK